MVLVSGIAGVHLELTRARQSGTALFFGLYQELDSSVSNASRLGLKRHATTGYQATSGLKVVVCVD